MRNEDKSILLSFYPVKDELVTLTRYIIMLVGE